MEQYGEKLKIKVGTACYLKLVRLLLIAIMFRVLYLAFSGAAGAFIRNLFPGVRYERR